MDFSQILGRFRAATANFTTAQLVTLGLVFLVVVGLVGGSALWLSAPNYALLFADMDPETASQIVDRLQGLKVPYQLDPGGRAIRVPSERVDELRLQLTSQGLPSSGRVGFEIFDRTAFGATEFLEHVNYRRALEGEIARTIATLQEVAGARVHISMGKDTLFGEPRPAKASVVLKVRADRPLAPSTVQGIGNLVAASVEGLRPESVVILDDVGRPLLRPQEDADDPLGAAQTERQQRLERDLVARVTALLEPVLGENRVRVNVALTLDPKSLEETEERWDPNGVIRSKQSQTELSSSATVPLLVAGARGNMPAAAATNTSPSVPAVAANTPGSSRQADTTRFELNRLTRHVVQPRGDVARMSVAVIVDDDQIVKVGSDGTSQTERVPRTPEELKKIQGLVAAAVGLNPERGDQIMVENVAFDEPLTAPMVAPTTFERFAPQIERVINVVVVLGVVLAVVLLVVRPALRNMGLLQKERRKEPVAGALPAVSSQAPRTVAELESEIEAQIDAAAEERVAAWRKTPVLMRKVATISKNEPQQVAKLLRTWMAEDGR